MLRIHIQKDGPDAVCEAYRPFGESQARKMHNLGAGFRMWPLKDITIKVTIYGDDAYVMLTAGCLSKLESGAIDVGHNSKFYVEKTDTCRVYKAGLTDIVDDPLLGTMKFPKDDPYQSVVYGLKSPPTPLPVTPPPDPLDYVDMDGNPDIASYKCALWPDQCDLLHRKQVLQYLYPSKGTGKMRVFLQALAGSIPSRIALSKVVNTTKAVLDGRITINPGDYIIRDTHGEYWLLNKFSAYRMSFSDCASSIKAALRAGGISRTREIELEAVLFSHIQTSPNPDYHRLVWPTPTGVPIINDWHFAYQMPKAVRVGLVTTIKNNIHPVRTGYLEELTFTTQPVAADGTFLPPVPSIRLLESAPWSIAKGNGIYWTIDPYTRTHTPGIDDGSTDACDGPVYAFYSAADVITVVRYYQSGGVANSTTTYQYLPWNEYGEQLYVTTPSGASTSGFYVTGGVTWSKFGQSSATASRSSVVNTISGVTWVNPAESVGTGLSVMSSGSYSKYSVSAILFPIGNPDAVYIGLMQRERRDMVQNTAQFSIIAYIVIANGNALTTPFYTAAENPSVVQTNSTDSVTSLHISINTELITPHGVTELEVYNGITSSTNAGAWSQYDPAKWGVMFTPDPYTIVYYGFHCEARESMGGGMRWFNDTPSTIATLPVNVPSSSDIQFIGRA